MTQQHDPLTEETISSQHLFSGRVLGLRVDTVQLPNGITSKREIVEHGPAVVLAPIDAEGRVLLVRQYRKAIGASLLELPAGGMEPGESPEESAMRELQEETGYSAGVLEALGGFYAAPGYTEEYLHLFLAKDLRHNPLAPDVDELLQLVPTSLPEAVRLIESGEIRDAKSVAGLLRVWVLDKGKSGI